MKKGGKAKKSEKLELKKPQVVLEEKKKKPVVIVLDDKSPVAPSKFGQNSDAENLARMVDDEKMLEKQVLFLSAR